MHCRSFTIAAVHPFVQSRLGFHVITAALFTTCACSRAKVNVFGMHVNCVLCVSMLFLEKDLKTKCVVEMEGNQTVLHSAITNMNKGDPR